VTYSVTYIATGSGKAAQGAGYLPPPITEMVPPTTASLAVLPIISKYDSEIFSDTYDGRGDIPFAKSHEMDGYLATPSGKIK
jgi:hypothetical protein